MKITIEIECDCQLDIDEGFETGGGGFDDEILASTTSKCPCK